MVQDNFQTENQKRKKSPKVFWGLILFFCLLVSIYWFLFLDTESTNNAQIAGHVVSVASRIEGQISKVYVENDIFVKEGAPLFELDNSIQISNVELAQADFDSAVASFKQATVDVKQARASFMSAQSAKDLEQKNLERVVSLKKQNAISQQAVDQQSNKYDQALANYEAAKAVLYMSENLFHLFGDKYSTKNNTEFLKYTEKMKGLNPLLDASIAKLKRAKASLDLANLNLSYTIIRAPFAGVTANKTVEIGKNVNSSVPLISIVSLDDTWIVANFKESQLRHMKGAQSVQIQVDAYGDKKFSGVVSSIGPASGETFALLPPDNASGNYVKVTQRFPVRIDFKPRPKESLRPGMSVEVVVK